MDKDKPKEGKAFIDEQDYLDAFDKFLPFSTSLRADLYLKLKRYEYWGRTSVREILEEALEEHLKRKPDTEKALPAKEANKLKQLKTAQDYRKANSEGKQ